MSFSRLFCIFLLPLFVLADAPAVIIGVIGDYGSGTTNELAVANLVKSWNPDFIMTVGDNNYPYGEASTIDQNVGQFFHDYIFPYRSEEHTSELQSRGLISYAVFCL